MTPSVRLAVAAGLVAASVLPAPVGARQAPVPPAAGGRQATPVEAAASAPPSAPKPAENYSYRPEGRRDPFVSLTAQQTDPRVTGRRPDGLAGALVSEVVLKGILQNRGSAVAVVLVPDGKTYLVHPGDRLLDGVVRAITADSLVLMQEVADPLSLTKQREVRKTLRVVEEVK